MAGRDNQKGSVAGVWRKISNSESGYSYGYFFDADEGELKVVPVF